MSYYSDPLKACENSRAVAVITDWEKIYTSVMQPAKVFKGRNILDKDTLKDVGFEIYSIGK